MKEDKEYLIEFGKHLKKVRSEKGMSAAELGRRCFLERSHISRFESGGTNPTLLTLKKICNALEIGMDELFEEFK